MGGNATRPGPHKARTTRAGPPRPAYFMRAENTDPIFYFFKFFFNFYDKTFNV